MTGKEVSLILRFKLYLWYQKWGFVARGKCWLIPLFFHSSYSRGRQRARETASLVARNPPMELQSFFIIYYSLITDIFFLVLDLLRRGTARDGSPPRAPAACRDCTQNNINVTPQLLKQIKSIYLIIPSSYRYVFGVKLLQVNDSRTKNNNMI